jgi:hypothetical protein
LNRPPGNRTRERSFEAFVTMTSSDSPRRVNDFPRCRSAKSRDCCAPDAQPVFDHKIDGNAANLSHIAA